MSWDKHGFGRVALVYGISRITVFVLSAKASLRIPSLLLFAQGDGPFYG